MEYMTNIQKSLKWEMWALPDTIDKEILKEKNELAKKIRYNWRRGLRPSGEKIGEYASEKYRKEKLRDNPLAGGNVDLIDTGDLNQGLTMTRVIENVFKVFSTDEKMEHIAEKYGLDNFNLSEKQLDAFFEGVKTNVIHTILNRVYKNI